MTNKHVWKRSLSVWVAGAAALLLAACAPTPQTVSLDPKPEVDEAEFDEPRTIALRVNDRRSMDIIGYRDRERGAAINSEPALAKAVEQGLREALMRQGYHVESWDPDAERRLDVTINRFEYERTGGFFQRVTTVEAQMDAVGKRNGQRHRAEVSSSSTDRAFLFGPSAQKNQRMISSVLDRSVSRIASEPEILRVLEAD